MVSLTSCIILLLAFGHAGSLLLDSVLVSRRAANQNSLLAFHSPQQHHSILKFKESDVNLDWDDNDEEENSDDDNDHLNSAQRSSVRRRYKLVSLVYASLGATLLFMPDKTLTKKLASKLGGAAGFGVAAGVSRMLLDATTEGRLHSPTTKRLNVGLLGFSFLGLLSVPGEADFLPTAGPAMILTAIMTSARMLGVLAAYSGWSMGVIANQTNGSRITLMNPRRAATEIYGGAISSFKNLKVRQETKKTTLTYRNCLLLVSASMFSSLMEGLFYVRYYGSSLGKSLFDISLQWSGVARLFLMSSLIFSLKDLADRDKMKGMTFIKLNLLVAAWAALVWVGQGLNITGYSTQRIEMLALSLPFVIKGLKAAKFRSDDKKKPLLQQPPAE